jgi:hypothetical protein
MGEGRSHSVEGALKGREERRREGKRREEKGRGN